MNILKGAAVAAVLALGFAAAVPAEAAMMERHHGMMGHHMMHRPMHRPMMHHRMMHHHRMHHGMMHRMHRPMRPM